MKTHPDEKLASLRNAVANAAKAKVRVTTRHYYSSVSVDEMTPPILGVLKVVAEHEAKFALRGRLWAILRPVLEPISAAGDCSRIVRAPACEDLKAGCSCESVNMSLTSDGLYEESSLLIEGKSPKPKLIVTKLGRKIH